jgi:hypothetical protein
MKEGRSKNAMMVLEGKENKFIYFLIKRKCDSKVNKEPVAK